MRNDHNNERESAVVGLVWVRWTSLIIRPSLGKRGLVLFLAVRSNGCPPNCKWLFPKYDCSPEILRPRLNGTSKPLSNKVFPLQTETPEILVQWNWDRLQNISPTSLIFYHQLKLSVGNSWPPHASPQRFFLAELDDGNGVVRTPFRYHIAPCELIFSFGGSRTLDSLAIFIHRVFVSCSRLQCSPLPPIPEFCPPIRCWMLNHSRV